MTHTNAKAAIFDMDGTMVDNMKEHNLAWHQVLNQKGLAISYEDAVKHIHGKNEDIIQRLYGTQVDAQTIHQIAVEKEALYRELYKPHLRLIEGLQGFIGALKEAGWKIGIGTAAPEVNVDFVLDGLGIRGLFDTIVDGEMVANGKPDPEVYIKAAKNLGVTHTNCLVFEDSPTGATAAEKAEMKFVIVGSDYPRSMFAHLKFVADYIDDYTNIHVAKADKLLHRLS